MVFKNKILVCPEAVDKMAFFSSLLHVWYLFCYKFGLVSDDAFEFVLFFAHQCNSTVTIVAAMLHIISQVETRSNWSMYKMLTEVCLKLNPTKNSRDKDVGCGRYNRHQTTATTLLSSSEVKEVISIMKSDFSVYREK